MKKLLFLFAVLLGTVGAWAQTFYEPGGRTTTLEAGKKYFISVATYYKSACTNFLRNNNGTLQKSDKVPFVVVDDNTYIFTVEEADVENNVYYIKNNEGKYLQSDNHTSTDTKTGMKIVPYSRAKGSIACGNDVDACDENAVKILYNSIDEETPIVCVYKDDSNGWRWVGGDAIIGKSTPFAFYEAKERTMPVELTTDLKAPILYTIKNLRGQAYAEYNGVSPKMAMTASVLTKANLFYFTAGDAEGTFKIHNYVTSKKCADTNSWTDAGIDWYIKKSENSEFYGFAISKEAELKNGQVYQAWNDEGGNHQYIALWGGNDAGSVWEIESYRGDFSEFEIKMSTENEKHLYFIKNDRKNKYANFVASGTSFTQTDATNLGSYWYFVEKEGVENVPEGFKACYIYNAAHNLPVQNHSNGYMSATDDPTYPAKVYFVGTHEHVYWGYVMYSGTNGWNDLDGALVTDYAYDSDGSIWSLIPADKTEAQLRSEANQLKTTALNFISHAEEADYYSYTDDAIATAKEKINGVNTGELPGIISALQTTELVLNTLKSTDRASSNPVAGEYIRLKNKAQNKYLKANVEDLGFATERTESTALWLLEEGEDGKLKIKNVSTGAYIGQVSKSKTVLMKQQGDGRNFSFTNQADVYGVFKDVAENDYGHGHYSNGTLVGWVASADASQWVISQTFPLTVTYMYNGKEVEENKITGFYVDKNETYTIVNPYSSRGYVAIESCSVNGEPLEAVDGVYSFKVTANTDVTVNLDDVYLPFIVSADYENAVWYYLQLNSSNWRYVSRATTTTGDATTEAAYPTNGTSRPTDDNGKWAFVGDAINGFKIINKGAGEGMYLNSDASNGSQASMAITEQQWVIQPGNGGFVIRNKEVATACLNNFKAQGELKIWNESGSTNGPGSAFRVELADLTKLKDLAREKLSYSGAGYPAADSQARTNLQNALNAAETTLENLYQLLDAYCQSDVEVPVSGKAYTFTNIMNDVNQTKRYMKYTSGEKLLASTSEDEASVFVCHEIRDGIYAFVTFDGKVLTWFSKDDDGAYKENASFKGYSTYYATSYDGKSDWNEIKVTKNGTSIDDLGHLRLVGRRNKDNVSSFIVYNGDGTFDRAGDSYFFNNNYSSAWLLNEITHNNTDAQSAAIAKIQAKETLKASTKVLGEGLGKYHYVVNDEEAYSVEVIDKAETADKVTEIAGTLAINLPETGKFYYIQSANTNQYLSNVKSNTYPETLTTTEQKSANNIFYFEGEGENTYLVAYENGHYVTNPWNIGVGEVIIKGTEKYKQTKSFVEGQVGKYALKYFSDKGDVYYFTASGTSTDAQQDNSRNDAQWNLESVTDLPLTIHSSGKSTYSAPVDLEIPDGVTVYYAKEQVGDSHIRMYPLTGMIPANTGVVVEGTGTVNFPITTGAEALENNLLMPVVAAKAVTAENGNSVFIMATRDGVTGFYPLSTTNNIIGGHKSYLEIRATNAARLSIVWDDTETGIFETEGGVQNAEIYDLTGRRLDKPVKGVNVIGGKLVIK